eukprot:4090681-Amphidinium_carterae.1
MLDVDDWSNASTEPLGPPTMATQVQDSDAEAETENAAAITNLKNAFPAAAQKPVVEQTNVAEVLANLGDGYVAEVRDFLIEAGANALAAAQKLVKAKCNEAGKAVKTVEKWLGEMKEA